MNRSIDVRRGLVVWSLRRGGRGCGEEVCERRAYRSHEDGCGARAWQKWRLSPTELEARRRGKEADHVEREGARAEPWTVERRATHDCEGREADYVET